MRNTDSNARSAETLLERLDPEQRAAVTHDATMLRILAGAGSGKTRVLTHRIAYRAELDDIDPRRVLALTFTRKAAGELTHRLRALGLRDSVAAGTFHAIAYAQLRTWWSEKGVTPPALLDRKLGFVARLLPRGHGARPDTAALDAVGEIEWAKARDVRPDAYVAAATRADRKPPFDMAVMADVYARYEDAKRDRKVLDFDDLLLRCRRALETDEQFAAAQRWRFRHLFVDEFQDVNPLQFSLLMAWLGDLTRGQSDLCVVGDPNQAIYSWNGADAQYLVDFTTRFAGAASVSLDRNYRSQPHILSVADTVLGRGRLSGGPLRPQLEPGAVPLIITYTSDKAEAAGIARAVRDHHSPGQPWSQQSVLARTNAQLPVIEQALRRAGVPVRLRGGGLLAAPEVDAALKRLSRRHEALGIVLDDLAVDLQLGRSSPLDPNPEPTQSWDEVDDREQGAFGFDDGVPDETTRAAAEQESRADADRRANLEALLRMGRDYLELDAAATGASFVSWARATAARDGDDMAGDAVELLTFHAAKGLEWPVVHLAGLEQGLVPIAHAKTDESRAEEDRLLYVAATRAQRVLRLSWASERAFGDRRLSRQPSPHLGRIDEVLRFARNGERRAADPNLVRATRNTVKATRGNGPAATKTAASKASVGPVDDALLARLKQWRSTTARAANVPAYVVFNDATLEAVASVRPTSRTVLATVPGIGPVKLERYGDTLLGLVTAPA
jgi:DNA helicase-2/ATP-dependent DNA helicase PcrA